VAPVNDYHKPADLPAQIPVFPLRGAILLPRAQLPLNVFEPRYLAMIDWVMSGARVLGIIQPDEDDHSAAESPTDRHAPLKKVGCLGRITAYQELDDGRIMITLTGICRFAAHSEAETPTQAQTAEATTQQPFRLFNVNYAPFAHDFEFGSGEDAVDRPGLLRILKAYLEANQLKADWKAISNAPTELLINSLSVISPFGLEEKQALLEAPDLKTRGEVLAALAEMELATDDRSGGQIQ